MEGVGQLALSLFGLRLEVEPALPGEVWHSDVVKVSVYADEPQVAEEGKWVHPWEVRYPIGPGVKIGTIYCDFFHRPGKMSVTDKLGKLVAIAIQLFPEDYAEIDWTLGNKPSSAAAKTLKDTYGNDVVNEKTGRRWLSRFKKDDYSLIDEPRAGCPKNSILSNCKLPLIKNQLALLEN
ncbi:hypothetical protein ACTXT7_017381 [Hymenolepis weldensis]